MNKIVLLALVAFVTMFKAGMSLRLSKISTSLSVSHGSNWRSAGSLFSTRSTSLNAQTANSITSPYKYSEFPELEVDASNLVSYSGDLLVIPFYRPPKNADKNQFKQDIKNLIPAELQDDIKSLVADIIDEGNFKGESQTKVVVRLQSNSAMKYVALVGLGLNPKKEVGDYEVSLAAKLGKTIATIVKDVNAKSLGIVSPNIANAGLTQLFLGLQDGLYNDNRFKKVPEDGHDPITLKKFSLLGSSSSVSKDISLTYKLTAAIAKGVNFAKDLVGAPPNCKTPEVIAELSKEIASQGKLVCKILNQKECEELNMGAYLGVQQGSKFPPQFIHLTYKPENPSPETVKIALVGKGLTFDSGGYNLKAGPGSMIELMKFDMGGCAAVLGTAKAIGLLRPRNVEVHFITAVCENMISAEAYRPGDILTASNGKTIEILNTDAEGRLTLADALVYADKLGVDKIIDLATLTGACIVGLGEKLAGLYSPDSKFRDEIEMAAKRSDEGIWSLPLEPSYKELIKSPLADLKNVGAKGGGSITAALFLQEFVENATWAHIDMAGPVWDTAASKPTGYGVKLLVDYLVNAKK